MFYIVYRYSLLGPVDPSCRALSERLKLTVRRHKFKHDSLSSIPSGLWISWIRVIQETALKAAVWQARQAAAQVHTPTALQRTCTYETAKLTVGAMDELDPGCSRNGGS